MGQPGDGKPFAKGLPVKAPAPGPKAPPPSSVNVGTPQVAAVPGSQAQSAGKETGTAHGENQKTLIFDS